MNNSTQPNVLKSNKIFAKELKRCGMVLEIYFTDNIEDKIIINKSEIDDLNKNKEKESNQNNKPNNSH